MITLKNKTGSPFDVMSKSGPLILPAFGELSAEFDESYIDLIRSGGSIDVVESSAKEEEPPKRRTRQRKAVGR